MGGSKILATLSDIFSSVDAEEDYQESVLSERKPTRQRVSLCCTLYARMSSWSIATVATTALQKFAT